MRRLTRVILAVLVCTAFLSTMGAASAADGSTACDVTGSALANWGDITQQDRIDDSAEGAAFAAAEPIMGARDSAGC